MNTVILGGTTKFGAYLSEYLTEKGNKVVSIGREHSDFSENTWVLELKETLVREFGDPDSVKLVVINAYDYHHEKAWVQENILAILWVIYQDKPVTIVVMGSMAWHDTKNVTQYARSKRMLHTSCFYKAQEPHKARLILLEPSMMENRIGYGVGRQPTVLMFAEMCKVFSAALSLELPYVHLAVCGRHVRDSIPEPSHG